MDDISENTKSGASLNSSLVKAIHILKGLAASTEDGVRLIDLARDLELSQPSAHRLLKTLIAEDLVEQLPDKKAYRLSLDFFAMAAQARQRDGILSLARPSLLRLSTTFNDTVFLLVRSNFDAVCLDRVEGPFPIRSYTILDKATIDEVDLRIMIAEVRETGASTFNFNMIDGMAGLGVPVLNRNGEAVAALSIGTLASRLTEKRQHTITELLRKEAAIITEKLNPFDPTLRHPSQALVK